MTHTKKVAALVLGAALASAPAYAATPPQEPVVDDDVITANVQAALAADKYLGGSDIDVSTDDSVVKLLGKVDTQVQYALAGQDATSVAGVKAVANMITVKESKQTKSMNDEDD